MTESGRKGLGLWSSPVLPACSQTFRDGGIFWETPVKRDQVWSAGNEESRFPGSSLDESRRLTATASFISSSARTGRCELGSAIGLYKQNRVNG